MQKYSPEGGVEPPTLRLKAARSSQLSYPGAWLRNQIELSLHASRLTVEFDVWVVFLFLYKP
jgi:hypothetical protein